jgi:hypothetical protein
MQVSHLMWNPTQQHATAAAGSELVTMRNGHHMLVGGFQVTHDTLYYMLPKKSQVTQITRSSGKN